LHTNVPTIGISSRNTPSIDHINVANVAPRTAGRIISRPTRKDTIGCCSISVQFVGSATRILLVSKKPDRLKIQ